MYVAQFTQLVPTIYLLNYYQSVTINYFICVCEEKVK